MSRGAESTPLIGSTTAGRGRAQALGPSLLLLRERAWLPTAPWRGSGFSRGRMGMQDGNAGLDAMRREVSPRDLFPWR